MMPILGQVSRYCKADRVHLLVVPETELLVSYEFRLQRNRHKSIKTSIFNLSSLLNFDPDLMQKTISYSQRNETLYTQEEAAEASNIYVIKFYGLIVIYQL